MRRQFFYLTSILFFTLYFLLSCNPGEPKTEYGKDLKNAYESEIREDSVTLGITLGMKKQDFFDHCTHLNQSKKITNGGKHQGVVYEMKNTFNGDVMLNFYPNWTGENENQKIGSLPLYYYYKTFANWNPKFSDDTLQLQIKRYYEKNFEREFKTYHLKNGDSILSSLKNQTEIRISNPSVGEIKVHFIDVTDKVDQELKKYK